MTGCLEQISVEKNWLVVYFSKQADNCVAFQILWVEEELEIHLSPVATKSKSNKNNLGMATHNWIIGL